MAVLIADDVKDGLSENEKQQLELFIANPGRGGQNTPVKIGGKAVGANHVSFGRGSFTVTVFYTRDGEDYYIVGVGTHDGKVSGKTKYSTRWTGRSGRVAAILG
jgi:hypothetical protein